MIILEIIFFLIASGTILLSLAGYGQFLINRIQSNFFVNIFFGFIVITFLITITHFFIKINFYVGLVILLLGLLLFVKDFNINCLKLLKKNYLYFLLFLILVPILISQKYHEDFGYYHLPYVISMIENKIIFGLANSNIAFSHNSIWLNTISIFAFPNNNFNFLTLPVFLIYFIFITFSLKKIFVSPKKIPSTYFLIICLFYFILKFTRISEYGNDIPAVIFSILTIFYFLKYSETEISEKKSFYFFNCFSFAIFGILIKFSIIPIFLLPLCLFCLNINILKKEIFKLKFIFIFILGLVFFIQQFVYTGCLFFPSKFTCLELNWFNYDFLLLRENLELTNKSYSSSSDVMSKKDYLTNFNWLPFWFDRNYPEILEHISTMLIPIILLIVLPDKEKNKIKLVFKYKIFFYIFIFLSFVFWLQFSPVYRFAIPYFLTFFFLISLKSYINNKFSTKIFLILIIFSLSFNFSKNILRISDKKEVFLGIEKIDNKFFIDQSSINEFIFVHRPDIENNKNGWQGRLCWDISFICSYNKIKVDKKYSYLFLTKLSN
jgi:hypothetical protein